MYVYQLSISFFFTSVSQALSTGTGNDRIQFSKSSSQSEVPNYLPTKLLLPTKRYEIDN